MPTRTTQVEIIIFKIVNNEIIFLLLKRNPQRGGFWQPVTGGVESGEDLLQAVNRELKEETGITEYVRIIEDVYYFEFTTKEYGVLKEHVFAVEIDLNTDIFISPEHTESRWCALEQALQLLKYDSNKVAFKKIHAFLISERS